MVKRICQDLKKPIHVVLSWSFEELQWWSVFYSIDDNQDKPIIHKKKKRPVTEEESIAAMKGIFR